MGPLTEISKIKRKGKLRDWNQLWSLVEAFSSGPLATSLECTSIVMFLVVIGTGEHLGLTKNSGGNGSEESGIPFGTSGWSPQMLCLKTQHL